MEPSARKHVNVQVGDRLPGPFSAVDHQPVAVLVQPQSGGDPNGSRHEASPEFRGGSLGGSGHMLFGDHQHVHRRLGSEVVEREDVVVLVNPLRREFPREDAAKQARTAHEDPP